MKTTELTGDEETVWLHIKGTSKAKPVTANDIVEFTGFNWGTHNVIFTNRQVRRIITSLKHKGRPIGSCCKGYFVMTTEAELKEYCDRIMKLIYADARLISVAMKQSMRETFGQLSANLKEE